MFSVTDICLILFLKFILNLNLTTCSITKPSNVVKIDNKVIQRKRQDTLELCKLFKTQTDSKAAVNRSKRVKRDVDIDKEIDSIGDPDDLQRVEQIVEKMYDDINEKQRVKVTYRRRFNPVSKTTPSNRRFEFAPSKMDFDNSSTTTKPGEALAMPKVSDGWIGPYLNWPKQWVHGVVPYYIDPATYDFNLQMQIDAALQFFERTTCVRFQKLYEKPTDKASMENVMWVYITNPTGIYQCVHSNEQKEARGVQMVILGYDCMSQGEIVHEVMHILGYSHEHTRPNRDAHITINWDNVKEGYKKYFVLRKDDPFQGIAYDYASILHYPQRAFSKNGKPTIVPQQNFKLGQRTGLSQGDVEKVNLVFGNQCIERNTLYLTKTCPIALEDDTSSVQYSSFDYDKYINHFAGRLWPLHINYTIVQRLEFTIEEFQKLNATMTEIFNLCGGVNGIVFNRVYEEVQRRHNLKPLDEPETSTVISQSAENNDEKEEEVVPAPEPVLHISRGTEPGCKCPEVEDNARLTRLVINGDCFASRRSLLHLFLHVLGFKHQHNMHDRDKYLKIEWDLLSPELKEELENKLPPEESLGFPYDYYSVMHLPWLTIKNGVQNIIYPVWNDGWSMGSSDGLSATDVDKINKLYCMRQQNDDDEFN